MGLDSKKDVHLDGSPVGPVSRLEVLEGASGRRVRSEAERARIVAESLLPGAQVSEVARKHGGTRWQILRLATTLSTARHVGSVRGIAVDIRTAGRGRCVGGASRSGDQA
ncbi:transposase [Bradyrhizobium ganzhouense]|uniref:transposase n=1 Tax=Bradyrhizobium ganzhouense TaxID=1179767 RepID=UPI003CF59863